MEIGTKYAFNNTKNIPHREVYIFIGYQDKMGIFIKDNQALFSALGAPYSKEAIKTYIETNDADALRKATDSILWHLQDEEGNPLWLNQEDVEQRIKALEQEMAQLQATEDKLTSVTFYETDCPNGDIFNDFIASFKTKCREAGLSTDGFTFHGKDGENTLYVCHNGYAKIDENDDNSHFWVFVELKKLSKYQRLNTGFMKSTTREQLIQY